MKVNQIVALGVALSKCRIRDEVNGAKRTESEITRCGVDGAILERRAGIEPANTGFADLRVSRFATGAY
jgi:hypothetical protein